MDNDFLRLLGDSLIDGKLSSEKLKIEKLIKFTNE
jgi:hypothetical protein